MIRSGSRVARIFLALALIAPGVMVAQETPERGFGEAREERARHAGERERDPGPKDRPEAAEVPESGALKEQIGEIQRLLRVESRRLKECHATLLAYRDRLLRLANDPDELPLAGSTAGALLKRLSDQGEVLDKLAHTLMAGEKGDLVTHLASLSPGDREWLLNCLRYGPGFLKENWFGDAKKRLPEREVALLWKVINADEVKFVKGSKGPGKPPLEERPLDPVPPAPTVDERPVAPPGRWPSAPPAASSPVSPEIPAAAGGVRSGWGPAAWLAGWAGLGLSLALAGLAWFRLRARDTAILKRHGDLEASLCLLKKGRVDEALRDLQSALPREGGTVSDRLRWALSLAFLAKRDVASALVHAQALDAQALPLEDVYQLARALQDAGGLSQAGRLFQHIVARDVSFLDARSRLDTLSRRPKAVPEEVLIALADRYDGIHLLGTGGMGRVFSARDRRLKRAVAIKVPDPALVEDVECRRRFIREAQVLAGLSHPNVVQVYDVVTTGLLHYTMELLTGKSLRQLLDERRRLPEQEAVALVAPIADALGTCHAQGLIHRDVKPENIVIDGRGVPRLADFGLALARNATRLTMAQGPVGTLAFMAPELLEGRDPTPAVDVYALGLVLVELLTGSSLYGKAPLTARIQAPAVRLSRSLPDISPALDALIAACTAPAPEDRPPDGSAMLERLTALSSAGGDRERQFLAFLGRLEALISGDLHSLKNRLQLAVRGPSGDQEAASTAARIRHELAALTLPTGPEGRLPERLAEMAGLLETPSADRIDRAHAAGLALLREFEMPLRSILEGVAGRRTGPGNVLFCLDLPPPPVRTADLPGARADLELVVTNLLDNAFVAGATAIDLVLGSAEPNETAATVHVRDNGPGIPAADRKRVLVTPFPERGPGRGTGLVTVARTVRRRGWRVELTDDARTTFRIVLPVCPDPSF